VFDIVCSSLSLESEKNFNVHLESDTQFEI
jgi:hypothetical protein